MGQGREGNGVLSRAFGKERVGELVECKWMYGLCLVLDFEIKKYHTIYEVYHFDTQDRYWVDQEDIQKV